MTNLTFEDGRATVELVNGTTLSILNEDRSNYLREYKRANPWVSFSSYVAADGGKYEVSLIDSVTEAPVRGALPEEFAEYYDEDTSDSYTVYAYVPEDVILKYINRIGRANVQAY